MHCFLEMTDTYLHLSYVIPFVWLDEWKIVKKKSGCALMKGWGGIVKNNVKKYEN